MKQTNSCPKCNSQDITRIKGQSKGWGAGSNIPAGLTILHAVLVTRYMCAQCGFIEH